MKRTRTFKYLQSLVEVQAGFLKRLPLEFIVAGINGGRYQECCVTERYQKG
jgi:hypothetical protein